MTTCQERVISRPQVGGRLDPMAPSGLFQLCDSDSDPRIMCWPHEITCVTQSKHSYHTKDGVLLTCTKPVHQCWLLLVN